MLGKLIVHSFLRNLRKKIIAIAAVMLATSLATFLLNWSLNLGDKIQRDLRAYGANILITPQGESLPLAEGNVSFEQFTQENFLKSSEIQNIQQAFWKNQIVSYAPLLPAKVLSGGKEVTLIGTDFGEGVSSLPKTSPYLLLKGKWPVADNELVAGKALGAEFGWKTGDSISLVSGSQGRSFRLTGLVQSGGSEDHQLFGMLEMVQDFTGHADMFKQLLVSAIVNPTNQLYERYQLNPKSLSPKEYERYSCTPYISSVAEDITKSFSGAEFRVVRQISQTEEKMSSKVNWLMILVTLAALVASSLTMTSTTTAMILQRKKELALMKAIGSYNSFIVFYLFAELFILAMIGSVAGYGLGSVLSMGLSRSLFGASFDVKWIVLPLVCFVGFLIIFCGSVFPLRLAITLEPAVALKDL
jgi:putative ABC transport system permease protein